MFLQPVRFIHLTTGRKKKSPLRQGGRLSRRTRKPGVLAAHYPPGDGYISHQTGSWENHHFWGDMLVSWRVCLAVSNLPKCLDHEFPFMSRIYCCVFSSNKNHRCPLHFETFLVCSLDIFIRGSFATHVYRFMCQKMGLPLCSPCTTKSFIVQQCVETCSIQINDIGVCTNTRHSLVSCDFSSICTEHPFPSPKSRCFKQ